MPRSTRKLPPAGSPSSPRTGTSPQADQRRRSLVEAAFQVLAERGFEGLRTREVAALAGVNIATLHYYFATKEDLIAGVAEHLLEQFKQEGARRPMDDPAARLAGELADVRHMVRKTPAIPKVLAELSVRASRDPAIAPVCHHLDESWHRYIQTIVEAGQAQGQFRRELAPAAAATLITSFMRGAILRLLLSPDGRWFKQASEELLSLLCTPTPSRRRNI